MTHLMKLELKKVGFLKYILFSILGIILGMFFILVGLNDTSTSIYDYDVTFQMIGLIFCFYYIILFSLLVVAYILSEYSHKTILVMFSYPVERKKLILAKLSLITSLMLLSMIIGYICCGLFIILIDKYFNLVVGDFHMSILSKWIPSALKTILMFCSLGLWTFIIGMLKKSVPMTIVSDIVLCYIRQFILAGTNIPEETWFLVIAVMLITMIGVSYSLAHKVNQLD